MTVPYLEPQAEALKGRKTLVLDLDETLVHSECFSIKNPDFILKLDHDIQKLYVLKRPHLEEFLEFVGKLFEVVVFTWGEREYATKVIKKIDPKGVISAIMSREYCTVIGEMHIKDLDKIGRDLKHVIFVDNMEESFILQPENGLLIRDFYNNRNDCELLKLIPFLEHLHSLDEVRPISKFHLEYRSAQSNIPQHVDHSAEEIAILTSEKNSKTHEKRENEQPKKDEKSLVHNKKLMAQNDLILDKISKVLYYKVDGTLARHPGSKQTKSMHHDTRAENQSKTPVVMKVTTPAKLSSTLPPSSLLKTDVLTRIYGNSSRDIPMQRF